MAFVIPKELMVSVSGVRGRVGEALTPEVVTRFASAFGAYLSDRSGGRRPRVVIARDSRTSGPMFVRAAAAALQAVGCDVIDLGLAPTPTTLFAIRHHRADGGIVVTASHNPVEWNALKLAGPDGMFLDAEEGPRMRAFLADDAIRFAGWDGLGDVTADDRAIERHLEAVLGIPYVDVDAIRRRRFRVALDCIGGAGTALLPTLLRELGCDVVGLNLEPNGCFPRAPEPVAENLGDLERLVRESGADLGLATDPDADRLAIVSEQGRAIGEDYTLALAATLVLRHARGPVVTNLSTSRLLDDVATHAGVPIYRTPVGEINVARRMQQVGAVVGGEGNGGVILPDVHFTRDAAVATALVLQLLVESGVTIEGHVGQMRRYAMIKDHLPRTEGSLEPAFAALESRLGAPDADRQDGLRLSWPADGKWVHLRASGTEPIIRIISEAPTRPEAEALAGQVREVLADLRRGPADAVKAGGKEDDPSV